LRRTLRSGRQPAGLTIATELARPAGLGSKLRHSLRESREDLFGLREAAHGLFREEEGAVEEHVELALLALADLRAVLRLRVDLDRETRGPFVVAPSDGAVEDADVGHRLGA
jgi:hypothetical protein